MKRALGTASMVILALALTVNFSQAQASQDALLINGAGATFPEPIYTKWFHEYNQIDPKVEINYQGIGSGGGIKQLTAKTVDFGASDTPMTDEELKAAPGDVLHIPTVLGAVVLSYNLPGLAKPIRLDAPMLADIFLGKIENWSSPRIKALNKDLTLPNTDIIVVYRSDSSGTTAVFTDYLSKVSDDWKTQVGHGKTVKWPAGLGGKGNEGVAGQIKNTPGAIGYIELAYAMSEKLPMAELKNSAGKFVTPSTKAASQAAAGALKTMPDDFRVSITNADGAESYPISSFTYLLIFKSMKSEKGRELVKFLGWAMDRGQKEAAKLNYAPLPGPMLAKVKKKIATIETR